MTNTTAAHHLTERHKGMFAILLAAVLWSTSGVFIKILPQDAYTILFYRSTIAAAFFGVIYRRNVFKMNWLAWANSGVYCLLMVTFVVATKLTTAANAIFLQYTAPIFVLVAEPILFKLTLKRVNVYTIIVCMVGMVVLLFGDFGFGNWKGDLLALASGILQAVMLLGQRKNKAEYMVRTIFWGNVLVALVGLPFFLQAAPPTFNEAAILVFLGVFQLGLGFWFFTYGLQRVVAVESALLAMIEPILNPVWVVIGYGEIPSPLALVGGGIIVLALAVRAVWMERLRRLGVFRN